MILRSTVICLPMQKVKSAELTERRQKSKPCACHLGLEGWTVLWIARTGSPWRDLPPSFGHWNSVFTRFRDWVKADVWKQLFNAVSDDPDMEYATRRCTNGGT